jgi:hypothetical protein
METNTEKQALYLERYNLIMNYLDEDKEKIEVEKVRQDLERYRAMITYFERNKDRVNVNRKLLKSLDGALYNHVKERPSFPRDKSTELYNRLHPLLAQKNGEGKLN